MLIISRKVGQDILIGDHLRLVVLKVSRYGEVQLGFEGPRDLEIWRGEIAVRRAQTASSTDRVAPSACALHSTVTHTLKPPSVRAYPRRPSNTPMPNQNQLPAPLSPFRTGRR